MNTPQPIKQLSVKELIPKKRTIRFYATEDLLERIKMHTFGTVEWNAPAGVYELIVNPLFEFEAVANWLDALSG